MNKVNQGCGTYVFKGATLNPGLLHGHKLYPKRTGVAYSVAEPDENVCQIATIMFRQYIKIIEDCVWSKLSVWYHKNLFGLNYLSGIVRMCSK